MTAIMAMTAPSNNPLKLRFMSLLHVVTAKLRLTGSVIGDDHKGVK